MPSGADDACRWCPRRLGARKLKIARGIVSVGCGVAVEIGFAEYVAVGIVSGGTSRGRGCGRSIRAVVSQCALKRGSIDVYKC